MENDVFKIFELVVFYYISNAYNKQLKINLLNMCSLLLKKKNYIYFYYLQNFYLMKLIKDKQILSVYLEVKVNFILP